MTSTRAARLGESVQSPLRVKPSACGDTLVLPGRSTEACRLVGGWTPDEPGAEEGIEAAAARVAASGAGDGALALRAYVTMTPHRNLRFAGVPAHSTLEYQSFDSPGIARSAADGFVFYRAAVVSGERTIVEGHHLSYLGPVKVTEAAFASENRRCTAPSA